MNSYLESLSKQFNHHLAVREKRPGVTQLFVPLFHADGDMVDVYLEESPLGERYVRVTDAGATLMRLSYDYEINTENKERIFREILANSRLQEDEGAIFIDSTIDGLYPAILQFGQGVAKVMTMRHFKREAVAGLFYEMVSEFVERDLAAFKPDEKVYPIKGRDDLEVDFAFSLGARPIYLFAVKDPNRARLATISCLEFQRAKLPHRSVIVYENMEAMPKKDLNRLTSAADKQFPNLPEFKQHARDYLEREAG